MSSNENYADHKERYDQIQREIAKTEGALDDRLEQLKKKHKVESEEELRSLLLRKEKKLRKLKKTYARIEKEYNDKWKHKLDTE